MCETSSAKFVFWEADSSTKMADLALISIGAVNARRFSTKDMILDSGGYSL